MNIKEIAEIAGVSASTVSKIINKKDSNLSAETRARVLKIVKENNYRPYATVQGSNTDFLVGVLVEEKNKTLGTVICQKLRSEGYAAILCPTANREDETKNINALCNCHVSGIIWNVLEDGNPYAENMLKRSGIPCWKIDLYAPPSEANSTVDYAQLAFDATHHLVQYNHKNIFCLIRSWGKKESLFVEGFKKCLFENKIAFTDKMVLAESEGEIPLEYFYTNSGVICFSTALAAEVYRFSQRKNKKIPKYMSVISLIEDDIPHFLPELSHIRIPFQELGEYAVKRLVAKMENKRISEFPFHHRSQLSSFSSVDVPMMLHSHKIVVVGSINMDTILSLNKFPRVGETTAVRSRVTIPGGKGLNQAVGAAKLGADVYLIGKLGKDYEGGELFDFLQSSDVNTNGISNTSQTSTGQAYIHVQNDGESGIVVYDGANGKLLPHDIESNKTLFEKASFCLLQTEINMDTVEAAAALAVQMDVKVLLKPAAVTTLSDKLLKMVDVIIPNEMEVNNLCPQEASLEKKALYLMEKGAKNVIITLGHNGCYWKCSEKSVYFSAAKFDVVDTTGAADAFAAALAVYLSKGKEMEIAIEYATLAAGFSTTKRGVPPSLIDQSTLEFFMKEKLHLGTRRVEKVEPLK